MPPELHGPGYDFPHYVRACIYVADVLDGTRPACKWERLACERHRADLAHVASDGEAWPFVFDPVEGGRICKFGELLPHVKGEWARRDPRTGKASRIRLEGWQCFILVSLFGWLKRKNRMRRFNFASIYVPRKNAKSTLADIIGLWMLTKDDEPGAEVYCGATTEKQALEVFNPARQMALKSRDMVRSLGITINARSLVVEESNSKFEPVIGQPGDGASPHCAIIDEYHEHLDPTLYDTMKTGIGARQQPLVLIISTAGVNIGGPCRDDWKECEQILDRTLDDPTKFALIFAADETDDWTIEAALMKAHPNWGVSVNPELILAEQAKAVRNPALANIFKTKQLNIWAGASSGWLNMQKWGACAEPTLSIEQFAGADCWVALDAASKIDMTSLVAIFRHGPGFAVFAWHYIPEATAQSPDRLQYQAWVARGKLITTPGARVDFTVIEDQLKALTAAHAVQCLAYDPKELNDFVNRVRIWAGFDLIEMPQSPALMSEPMKEVEAQVEDCTLRHSGTDEVLTWMMANVVKKEARGGGEVKYYYPTKERAVSKIDGAVALIMAMRQGLLAVPNSAPGFAFS